MSKKVSPPANVTSIEEVMVFLHTLVNDFNAAIDLQNQLKSQVIALQEEVATLKNLLNSTGSDSNSSTTTVQH